MVLASPTSHALTISFEDIPPTRDSFTDLGIVDTYQGYEWGFGHFDVFNGEGLNVRNFNNFSTGWAVATTSNDAAGGPPIGVGGSVYAWNWNGPQSLWIDFRGLVDFTSGRFSTLGPLFPSNASTLQLFGYDAADVLIATSTVFDLTDTLTNQIVNFANIRYLELRRNRVPAGTPDNGRWFSVDDLVINENSVDIPEPSTLAIFAFGLAGLGFVTRRRKRSTQD